MNENALGMRRTTQKRIVLSATFSLSLQNKSRLRMLLGFGYLQNKAQLNHESKLEGRVSKFCKDFFTHMQRKTREVEATQK